MKKVDKWKVEKELQRALAIEYVRDYCRENKISIEKLEKEIFDLSYQVCGFLHPSDIESDGLLNDVETMPKPTLTIRYENNMLSIEQTEFTKEFLSAE
jgi:hypothetical protein